MGKKLVSNPLVTVIHDVPEEVKQKLAALEMELIQERAIKKSGIREIIKIEEKIVYKDDPDLLKRFNETAAELGKLKMSQGKLSVVTPETVIKEIVSEKIVDRLILDKKLAIIISASSFFTGSLFILIIEKLIGFPLM